MGRKNEIISKGKGGRPKGKGVKGTSRNQSKCEVKTCQKLQRKDKIIVHQRLLVLWTDAGNPAGEDHPEYSSLIETRKSHTDYFRENGFTINNMPRNIEIAIGPIGPMDRFVGGDN